MAKEVWGNILVAKYYGSTNSKSERVKLTTRYGSKFVPYKYGLGQMEGVVKHYIKSAKLIGAIGNDEIFLLSSSWNGEIKNV